MLDYDSGVVGWLNAGSLKVCQRIRPGIGQLEFRRRNFGPRHREQSRKVLVHNCCIIWLRRTRLASQPPHALSETLPQHAGDSEQRNVCNKLSPPTNCVLEPENRLQIAGKSELDGFQTLRLC